LYWYKCVRLSRLLAFECTLNHCTFISFHLIELFSLFVTAEALRANIGSKSAISFQRGPVNPNFPVEGVVLHQSFFFSEN